jgi:hypothetical protein
MKNCVIALFFFVGFIYTSFALSIDDAENLMKDYIGGSSYVSKINVCENEKYFVGEVYLEGYEKETVIRKIFIDKKTGGIYPTMSEAFNYCYMMERKK